MIKKQIFLLVGLLALFAIAVNAQQSGFTPSPEQGAQGGFRGPSAGITSVADAKTLRDDTPVILSGRIEHFLGNEKYLFSDKTGTITVEIERKVWRDVTVNEHDLVEISGEIDRDWHRVEVEVKHIRKL